MERTVLGGRWISMLLVISIFTASCTSMKPVKLDQVQTGLKQGDVVKVVTKDGRTFELEIVSVTPEAIVGKDQRIEFADIMRVEKRGIDAGKTAALGAGVLAVGLITLFFVGLAAADPALAMSGMK